MVAGIAGRACSFQAGALVDLTSVDVLDKPVVGVLDK
jgi:hypothetical protein